MVLLYYQFSAVDPCAILGDMFEARRAEKSRPEGPRNRGPKGRELEARRAEKSRPEGPRPGVGFLGEGAASPLPTS